MKVTLNDGKTYLVHWKIRPFKSIKSKKELSKTTCIIRELKEDGTNVAVAKESVSQYSKDQSDNVLARKLSLTKALGVIFRGPSWKEVRTSFWDKYKKTARVTHRTIRVKNHELRTKNADLKAEVADLEERLAKFEHEQLCN